MSKRRYADELYDELTSSSPSSPTPSGGNEATPTALLEEAANLITSVLPPTVRDFFNEVADSVLKISRWELLAGSVMSQYAQGTLVSPDLDPSWREPQLLVQERTCSFCSKPFRPERIGQLYCSNSCAGESRRKDVERRVAEARTREARSLISYITTLKEEIAKTTGKQPTQAILAHNVYSLINPLLPNSNQIAGMRIKVDMEAPDDRIYLTT